MVTQSKFNRLSPVRHALLIYSGPYTVQTALYCSPGGYRKVVIFVFTQNLAKAGILMITEKSRYLFLFSDNPKSNSINK